MPTINCFNNKKVIFGKPNKFYNLLSDNLIHAIAHVNDKDLIDSFFIHINNNIIKCTNKFYLNNIPLYRRSHFYINEFQGFVEPQKNNTCLNVEAGKYSFYICKNQGLEIYTTIRNDNVNPKGIIGQTYKNLIELPESKYEIKIKLI
jgi:hypothetical protein